MKYAIGLISLAIAGCGGLTSSMDPDVELVGSYFVTLDKAFAVAQSVLQTQQYEIATADPARGTIVTKPINYLLPKGQKSFRTVAKVIVTAGNAGLTTISASVFSQNNENSNDPQDLKAAEWGRATPDLSKQAEVKGALAKALSNAGQ